MDPERLILYPELIYRRYQRGALADEAVLKIPMPPARYDSCSRVGPTTPPDV
jgi:hypothetical protein